MFTGCRLLIRQSTSIYHLTTRTTMSSTSVPFLQVLATSVTVIDRAGQAVRSILAGGKLDIVEKTGADDLQTKADRHANDLLCGSLKKAFPKINVIGEEGHVNVDQVKPELLITEGPDMNVIKHYQDKLTDEVQKANFEDLTVWIDPLDGTKEFTEGFLDHVTVLVGIAIGNKAIGGVIHQPFWNYQNEGQTLGRTFHGIIGSGIGGQLSPKDPPEGQRIVTSSRSHSTGLVDQVIQSCQPSKVISVGGAGHKVILLMEGQAHCYVFCSPGCKKWDTCAPEAILHAMGGKLTDIKGNFYEYHKDVQHVDEWGILATAKKDDHEGYLNMIPDEYKNQVKDYFKNRKK